LACSLCNQEVFLSSDVVGFLLSVGDVGAYHP